MAVGVDFEATNLYVRIVLEIVLFTYLIILDDVYSHVYDPLNSFFSNVVAFLLRQLQRHSSIR